MDITNIEILRGDKAKSLRDTATHAIFHISLKLNTSTVEYVENGYWDFSREFDPVYPDSFFYGMTEEDMGICRKWIKSWLHDRLYKLDESNHVLPV